MVGSQAKSKRPNAPEATSPSSGEPGRKVRRKINRGLTCANCRARKTRCDGGQPGCKTCEVYEDECRYDQLPPLSQIRSLTQRLQEAEAMIKELQHSRPPLNSGLSASSPTQSASQIPAAPMPTSLGEPTQNGLEALPPASHSDAFGVDTFDALWNTSASPGQFLVPPTPIATSSQLPIPMRPRHVAVSDERSNLEQGTWSKAEQPNSRTMASDLSLDANGQLCYYGPTSNVHDPPTHSPDSISEEPTSSKNDVKSMLMRNAREARQWEEFALGTGSLQSDIPRDILGNLLATHWTWIAPTFMWVYRPAFMRDMTTGGQYFSEFLLVVLCAHSARFAENPAIGEMLISRARLMLGNEIDKPLSIPTVQALLQLSARDLAYGRISQAWLYSGMGFRMVSDLGLHHSANKIAGLGQLGPEDLEIRRRLFWSCYFWDKAISLYLGRMPVLLDLPPDSAPELLDDSVEHDIWSPYASSNSNNIKRNYPPYKSHAITCFINSCKLSVIINSIIQQLYSRRNNPDFETVLPTIPQKLDEWRRDTPAHLLIDPDNVPEFCPPPNILTQNLLYYTTIILLHRPFLSSPSHRQLCRQAAVQTEKLLLLLESTFSFTRITYLMAYCIYTSASVLLNDVKAGDQEASQRMQTLLRALRGGIATCPILQRSLDIITNSLNSPSNSIPTGHNDTSLEANIPSGTYSSAHNGNNIPHDGAPSGLGDIFSQQAGTGSAQLENNTISTSLLPAFLFAEGLDDSSTSLFSGGALGNDPFSSLDCFPENRLDGFGSEWFLS